MYAHCVVTPLQIPVEQLEFEGVVLHRNRRGYNRSLNKLILPVVNFTVDNALNVNSDSGGNAHSVAPFEVTVEPLEFGAVALHRNGA